MGGKCFTSVVHMALHPPFELPQLSLRCTKSKEKRGSKHVVFAPLLRQRHFSSWVPLQPSDW